MEETSQHTTQIETPTKSFVKNRGNNSFNKNSSRTYGLFCPGCYYLSQQLNTTINFKHTPGDCPRKAVAIKLFQVEDSEHFGKDEQDVDDGKIDHSNTYIL